MIPELGAKLVELAAVKAGEDVLDVATGSGNAALPAARLSANVTALDITPSLLDAGAKRARAAGLSVEWVNADAKALPFAEESFDRVLSCVGVQFCGEPLATAGELLRVCRDGGIVALISWTPEGLIGKVLAAVGRATGASGPSPLQWGRESAVKQLFVDAKSVSTSRETVEMSATSDAGWVDYMAAAYGPLVTARRKLEREGGWAPLRAQLCELAAAHDVGAGEGFAGKAEYLAALIKR